MKKFTRSIFPELLWSSPEILRGEENVDRQKCDMYSAGIIFKEVFCRNGPYTEYESMLPAGKNSWLEMKGSR